jgi:hypothetical protein
VSEETNLVELLDSYIRELQADFSRQVQAYAAHKFEVYQMKAEQYLVKLLEEKNGKKPDQGEV